MRTAITHFYRLNAFRFFAAWLVMIGHAESLREARGDFSLHAFSFFKNGQHAVTFFFVLSGFLITYLLLKEKKTNHQVNVKHFYWKRVVRIWPLYFLLVLIGLFIQPLLITLFHVDYQLPYEPLHVFPYFLLFVPGLTSFFYGSHLLEPLWSIGVEEWFYLIWGPFVKWIKSHFVWWIIGFLVLKISLNQVTIYGHFPPVVVYFVRMMQMESMSLGALVAWLFFKEKPFAISPTFLQLTQYFFGALILAIVFWNQGLEHGLKAIGIYEKSTLTLINAVIYAAFIGATALRNKQHSLFDHPWLNWCGEISYGIYMYHLLVVTLIWGVLAPLHLTPFLGTILFHVSALATTLLVAGLSKKYIENPILKWKNWVR